MNELYQWLVDQVTDNDIFAGMIGGSLFMSLLYSLRRLPPALFKFLQRQLTVELTVYNSSETFIWIEEWLSATRLVSKSRRLKLESNPNRADEGAASNWLVSIGEGLPLLYSQSSIGLAGTHYHRVGCHQRGSRVFCFSRDRSVSSTAF